jgi:peptidoglycan/xylan/chitin deacetylase (PgdA/CDA1 family)
VAEWPGGAGGALCLSFDNLGEAAEIELGAPGADAAPGDHFTVTRVLPAVLDSLRERDLAATFFVEGLNAELYPEALKAIAAAGHELAYHAWRHEQWGELPAAEQAANLARGIGAFEALGLSVAGLRPPGGQLGAGGVAVLREAGLRYCSPAGAGASAENGVALLPFQWRHVDASCLLPPLGPIRTQITGTADPIDADGFLRYLEAEIERLAGEGGFASLVLHLPMFDWWGQERFCALLDRLREASRDGVWVAPCATVAEHVLANRGSFAGATRLDTTSWAT